MLREHFLQAARSRPEKVLPPELEKIFEPRELGVDEPEDDETETARALSEREAGALPTTPQPGASTAHRVATALRHAGARREAIRFVLKELRCPTCEARPLIQTVYWYRFGGLGGPKWDFSQSSERGLLGHWTSSRPRVVEWVHGTRCDV